MRDFYGEVYIVVNQVNHKVYIGQTTRTLYKRWADHCRKANTGKGNCVYFYNAIRKYGESRFFVYRLNVAFSKEELDALEVSYIAKFRASDSEYGYNSTLGGGGVVANEATREKFKAVNKGEGNPMFGRHPSEESRAKMSKAQKGHICSEATKRAVSKASRERVASDETRRKLSIASKGRKLSEASRAKLSAAKMGHPSWNKGQKMPLGFSEKVAAAKRGIRRPDSVGIAVGEANKNRPPVRWINNQEVELKVGISDLPNYLESGWNFGRKYKRISPP
jgi:group I intron endonuclease